MDKSTQTATGEGNAPRVATQRTIDQWFAYQDRTIGEIHALNMELQSVEAQRDELLSVVRAVRCKLYEEKELFDMACDVLDKHDQQIPEGDRCVICNADAYTCEHYEEANQPE